MPCTPIAESASRTSSSLKGLMIAVTSFMRVSVGRRSRAARLASESFADRKYDRVASGVLALAVETERRVGEAIRRREPVEWAVPLRIRPDIARAEHPAADVLRYAHFVVRVVGFRVAFDFEMADVTVY